MTTTVGKSILLHFLPKDMHEFIQSTILDKKGITQLFSQLAERHPVEYGEIVSHLARTGFEISTRNGASISLQDLTNPIDTDEEYKKLDKEVDLLNKQKFPATKHQEKLFNLYSDFTDRVDKQILQEGVKQNKTLAKIVVAGSRGSVGQYRSTVATQGVLMDANQKPILDFPVKKSFAEGLTLPEYLIHGYGSRNAEVMKKLSVASSGYSCLEENTEVRMADYSVKKIKDIKVGDLVLGANFSGKTFPVEVSKVFDNGLRECNDYRFRVGKSRTEFISLVATKDHFTLSRLKGGRAPHIRIDAPAKLSLSKASRGFQIVPAKDCLNDGIDEYDWEALLIGYLIGDGGLTGHSINLSTADLDLIKIFNSLLNPNNLNLKKIRNNPQDYEYILSEIKESAYKRNNLGQPQRGGRHFFRNRLNELGLVGKYSYEKVIPEEVYTWSNNKIGDLIAGLYEADGCISSSNNSSVPLIGIKLTSKYLVEQVRDLLRIRFGIYAPAIEKIPKENIGNSTIVVRGRTLTIIARRDVFCLRLNDLDSVERFSKYIRLPGVKGKKLKELIGKIDKNGRYDGFYFHFSGLTPKGLLHVFDIEVNHPDHLYVLANGMVVSNSKQLSRASMTSKVEEHDCGTDNGLPVSTEDKDSIGCFLAQPVGEFKKNNEVTSTMLNTLHNKGIKTLVARSPITCASSKHFHFGALCQMCCGKREKGLPEIGSYVGLIAGSSLSEPLTQAVLSIKHRGSAAVKNPFSGGFKVIDQLFNIPKTFKNKAALAEEDGVVTSIKPAAAGGTFIHVNDKEHYVPVDFHPLVRVGDKVEAGDTLSEGLINPAEVVHHKGIGAGRKYFVETMKKVFDQSGMNVNRRNFELAARSAVDHVKITHPEGIGDYLPDQVVSYQTIEKAYKPRTDAETTRVDHAYGKYLEAPVLHHTIGTRLTHSVIDELKKADIHSVIVHKDPPPFEPEMVRLLDVPKHVPDWAHQLYSTGLEKALVDAVGKGLANTSSIKGPSPILGIAHGVGFGSD